MTFHKLYSVLGQLSAILTRALKQARNQGGEAPPRKFFSPLEKCVGHRLKRLDMVQKILAPLAKLFTPPGVPRWIRACLKV